jgi:lysophospholipase L1-like esterase
MLILAGNAIIIAFLHHARLSLAAGTIAYNQGRAARPSAVRSSNFSRERGTPVIRQNLCIAIFFFAALAAISVPLLIAQRRAASPAAPPSASNTGRHPAAYYAWKKVHDAQLLVDFGGLDRFREANVALPTPKPGENRIVFMGDSITEDWHLEKSFPGKPYINRGISGQTSPQMLVRFRQDVVDLKPKVVLILAGTNDIMENTGPMTTEQSGAMIASMSDLATTNNIQVVLCSVLPSSEFAWSPALKPAPKIVELNAWIKNYAVEKGYVYVDYYSAMTDDRGGLPPALSDDGVHPISAGFAIMAPLAEAGIHEALRRAHNGRF